MTHSIVAFLADEVDFSTEFTVAIITAFVGFAIWIIKGYIESRRVGSALLTELHNLNKALENRYAWWIRIIRLHATTQGGSEEANTRAQLPKLLPFYTAIFDQLAGKMGSINQPLGRLIVEYHGFLRFINGFQETQEQLQTPEDRERFEKAYTKLLNSHRRTRGDHTFRDHYWSHDLTWKDEEAALWSMFIRLKHSIGTSEDVQLDQWGEFYEGKVVDVGPEYIQFQRKGAEKPERLRWAGLIVRFPEGESSDKQRERDWMPVSGRFS